MTDQVISDTTEKFMDLKSFFPDECDDVDKFFNTLGDNDKKVLLDKSYQRSQEDWSILANQIVGFEKTQTS